VKKANSAALEACGDEQYEQQKSQVPKVLFTARAEYPEPVDIECEMQKSYVGKNTGTSRQG